MDDPMKNFTVEKFSVPLIFNKFFIYGGQNYDFIFRLR
jgi:hypothetical protein